MSYDENRGICTTCSATQTVRREQVKYHVTHRDITSSYLWDQDSDTRERIVSLTSLYDIYIMESGFRNVIPKKSPVGQYFWGGDQHNHNIISSICDRGFSSSVERFSETIGKITKHPPSIFIFIFQTPKPPPLSFVSIENVSCPSQTRIVS
jgi:hypothetical protein